MNPLDYTVSSLDGLDESVSSLYKSDDKGGFVLNVGGVVPKSRLNEFRDNNTTLRKTLESFGTHTPESISDALSTHQRYGSGELIEHDDKDTKLKVDGLVDKRVDEMRTTFEATEQSLTTQLASAQESLSNLTINANAISLALEHGLQDNPKAQEMLGAEARKIFKLVDGKPVAMDANGEPLYGKDSQALTMGEFIVRSAKDMPFLFKETQGAGSQGGGGSQGSVTKENPWITGNRTHQAAIITSDPALATRYKEAARKASL